MKNCMLNSTEYNGKYVVLESESNNSVAGVGDTPEQAWEQAKSKGYLSPVLLYVEEPDAVLIYRSI
jgi:hypothetical protein